jgi:hypothetical protein
VRAYIGRIDAATAQCAAIRRSRTERPRIIFDRMLIGHPGW